MPHNLKDRGNRLSAFARGKSDSQAHYNETAQTSQPSPEKRPETTQAAAAPTRQEVAEDARLPIPKSSRQVQSVAHHRPNGGFAQPSSEPSAQPTLQPSAKLPAKPPLQHPRPVYPTRPLSQSPPPVGQVAHPHELVRSSSSERRHVLFQGSELGDSFMRSGCTSPLDDMDELEPEPAPIARDGSAITNGQNQNRTSFESTFRDAAFYLGNDGLMSVVSTGARHNPSHMNDGFHPGALHSNHNKDSKNLVLEKSQPSSPHERQTKLPTREVKIRRVHSARPGDNRVKGEPRSSDHSIQRAGWRTPPKNEDTQKPHMYQDSEDDLEGYVGLDEQETTPKAKIVTGIKAIPHSTLLDGSLPATAPTQHVLKGKKRGRGNADYDDMMLSSMTFPELQNEPFDLDPAKEAAQNGHGAGADNLELKLEQGRHQGEKEQRKLFASMSVDDWEVAGDWFVDQFAGIMQKVKEGRRNKRRLVQEFESEAADREEAVRLRSEAIDRKLGKMRQDGQRVVGTGDT